MIQLTFENSPMFRLEVNVGKNILENMWTLIVWIVWEPCGLYMVNYAYNSAK
jgi:hypothetical protein